VVIASAAAGVLGFALPAARAFGWFTANTRSVTPADPAGPTDGETVRVSGRWTNATGATTTTSVYECPVSAIPHVGHHVDPARCDPHNVDTGVPTKGGDHGFSDYLVWDATFSPPATPTSTVDCTVPHACAVVADATFAGFFADMQRGETTHSICRRVFGEQHGHARLLKTTNVIGAVVAAGQTITSTFTFPTGDFDRNRDAGRAASVTDCVQLGKTILTVGPTGSWHDKPGPWLGAGRTTTFHSTYVVPADTPTGTQVCDRGVVSGLPDGDHDAVEYSRTLCFTVGVDAVLPEAPWPLALPASALAVGGGWFLWRRRRARRPAKLRGT